MPNLVISEYKKCYTWKARDNYHPSVKDFYYISAINHKR